MGGIRSAYKVFVRYPEGKRLFGRIILRSILRKQDVKGVDWSHVVQDSPRFCGDGNEYSSSIKGREFLTS
jgi:hypothetical protein